MSRIARATRGRSRGVLAAALSLVLARPVIVLASTAHATTSWPTPADETVTRWGATNENDTNSVLTGTASLLDLWKHFSGNDPVYQIRSLTTDRIRQVLAFGKSLLVRRRREEV